VTNVPGPQFPLYILGREMQDMIPMVPLAPNQAFGVAIMSYNGGINFGLVGDYDVMYDLDDLAHDFEHALAELAAAAGVTLTRKQQRRFSRPDGNGHKGGRRIGTSDAVSVGPAADPET
jgi:diacylglycerol O-acyltransferase / wax synthase